MKSCVYYYPFTLNKEQNQNNKQKETIQVMDFFLMNELTNLKRVKKMGPRIHGYSNVSKLESKLEKELKEEELTNSNGHKAGGTFARLRISERLNPHGISELTKQSIQPTNIKLGERVVLTTTTMDITLRSYLSTIQSPKKYLFTIIEFYKKLLALVYELHKAGTRPDCLLHELQIVHNFINMDSILVNSREEPILSNFKYSLNLTNNNKPEYFKRFFLEYDPTYTEWSPEFHILAYLRFNNNNALSAHNIETIITEVSNNKPSVQKEQQVKEGIKYFSKYVNQSYEDVLADVLQYSYSWDNYALSILFLKLKNPRVFQPERLPTESLKLLPPNKSDNKFLTRFSQLLLQNIHMVPLKRLSPGSTLDQFVSILDSTSVEEFKELLDI